MGVTLCRELNGGGDMQVFHIPVSECFVERAQVLRSISKECSVVTRIQRCASRPSLEQLFSNGDDLLKVERDVRPKADPSAFDRPDVPVVHWKTGAEQIRPD